MAKLDACSVGACRPGSIADDSDSDGEDDEAGDSARFWLFAVVQKCCVSPAAQTVRRTKVKKGERYIVIRWLEKEGDDEIHYVLSDVEDCLSGRSVEGIFVVKSLGKIKRLPPIGEHGPIKKKNAVKYLLHKDNIGKIACLLPRIPL